MVVTLHGSFLALKIATKTNVTDTHVIALESMET